MIRCLNCKGSGKFEFKEIKLKCDKYSNKCCLSEEIIGNIDCTKCAGVGKLPSDTPFIIPL